MNNVWTVKPSPIIRDHAITVENHGHWSDHTVITGVITPITPCEGVITVKGVITPVITGVICDHAVITKYFYWGVHIVSIKFSVLIILIFSHAQRSRGTQQTFLCFGR